MKKFKAFYIGIIAFIIIMILTKGFSGNVLVYSYDDAKFGIVDGFQEDIFLSIINCFIVLGIIISTIIMTFNKKNKIKNKMILFAVVVLLTTFIPIGRNSYSGGSTGIVGEKNVYCWDMALYLIK